MIIAMGEVGRLFEEGEYFVPEMLISARAMQSGLAVLKPVLVAGNYKPVGKVVIGTVKGDLHDIGKNLVSMMLEGAAFEIIDLGADVTPEKFVDAVKTTGADIVAMSALLTTTMPSMKVTIEALKCSRDSGSSKSNGRRSSPYRKLCPRYWCRWLLSGCQSRCRSCPVACEIRSLARKIYSLKNSRYFSNCLTFHSLEGKIYPPFKKGPVAQLGARFNRTEEVEGSNPSRSTGYGMRKVHG